MPNESKLPTLLIVGAGPVGLMMASELVRHGVPCRIIDKNSERSQTSKALGIFPRTLEVFEATGVIEEVLAAGQKIFALNIRHQEKVLARIDLSTVASPYPFVFSLPQSETERILIEHLARLGVEVERNAELVGLTQTDTVVQALVKARGWPRGNDRDALAARLRRRAQRHPARVRDGLRRRAL